MFLPLLKGVCLSLVNHPIRVFGSGKIVQEEGHRVLQHDLFMVEWTLKREWMHRYEN